MAIVFGHEIHIFIPKFGQNSHGGVSTGLGNIPKKTILFLPLPYVSFLIRKSCHSQVVSTNEQYRKLEFDDTRRMT